MINRPQARPMAMAMAPGKARPRWKCCFGTRIANIRHSPTATCGPGASPANKRPRRKSGKDAFRGRGGWGDCGAVPHAKTKPRRWGAFKSDFALCCMRLKLHMFTWRSPESQQGNPQTCHNHTERRAAAAISCRPTSSRCISLAFCASRMAHSLFARASFSASMALPRATETS